MNIYDIANGLVEVKQPKPEKKRYRFNHDTQEWVEVKPPQPPAPPEREENWELAKPPVAGEPCDKCGASTIVVFHDGREQPCHWCTDGRGLITINDERNFRRRQRMGLPICFIKTVA